MPGFPHVLVEGACEPLPQPADVRQERFLFLHDDLGGRRRRGGAHVGREIRQRKIDLVAHGGNDGRFHLVHCAHHDFFVERPQVFEASAAAADY